MYRRVHTSSWYCVFVTQTEWRKATHRRIAGEVKRVRKDRGITAADLAERVGMTRDQITGYETRRNSLDVADLLLIAAALKVPPIQLLYPGNDLDPIDMLPDQEVATVTAVAWFTGDRDRLAAFGQQIEAMRQAMDVLKKGGL
jgi:transcriptional regulator with XRE-family HTH domain